MKPASPWLRAAVLAHEARTLDNQRHVRDAWEALLQAAERERHAGGRLDELAAAWAAQRSAAQWEPLLEGLYGRFHTHLHHQSDQAGRHRTDCRDRWEATMADLQSSHSTQRLLERLALDIEAAHRQALSAREARSCAEAWMLSRHGLAATEPDRPQTHASGGASDTCAS